MAFRTGLVGAAALSLVLAGAAIAQDNDEFAFVGTSLFGENEVGHKGAGEDVSGDFSAEIDLAGGQMCYMLEVEGIDDFAAAHVHEGTDGKNGPPVVTLELLGEDGDDVCVDVDAELLAKIAEKPERYYVNVHTASFPQGAIRGQLGE